MDRDDEDTVSVPLDIQAMGEGAIQHFFKCIANGCDQKFAHMLAARRPPRCLTDREFLEGRPRLGDLLTPRQLKTLKAKAKKAGVSIGENDYYMSSLASEPLDPLACIPATGGRGHVKKVCELRDQDCHGAVEHRRRPLEAPPIPEGKHLAPDLAMEAAKRYISEDHRAAKEPIKDLMQQAVQDHGLSDENLAGQFSSIPNVRPINRK